MAQINRFMQPINPVIVNPISIEQFAMIPLAKAQAKAAGIQALSTYVLPYNVDRKDQGVIKGIADQIETAKSDITNRIIKEGVSENLITDFMGLKQNYRAAKEKVKAAEANKVNIDQWKKEVWQAHHNDAAYVERIYDKEYNKGWNGTFNEDGTANVFDKTKAPMSFSLFNDFDDSLRDVSPEEIQEFTKKGFTRVGTEMLPNGKIATFAYKTDGSKVYSNESKLVQKLEGLFKEYSDPNSTRGAYVNYDNIDPEQITFIANKVLQSKIQRETRGGESSKSVIDVDEIPVPENEIKETYDTDNLLPTKTEQESKTSAFIKYTGSTIWNYAKWGLKRLVAQAGGDPKEINKVRKEAHKELVKAQKGEVNLYFKRTKEQDKISYGKDIQSKMNDIFIDNVKNPGVVKYSPTEEQFMDEYKALLAENPNYFKGNELTAEGAEAIYELYGDYEDKMNFNNMRSQVAIIKNTTLENSKLGLKNDLKGGYSDLASGIEVLTEDGGSNRSVMDITNKTMVADKDIINGLQSGLRNVNKEPKEGEYFIEKVGDGSADTDFYRVQSDDGSVFEESVAFGHVVNLYKMEDGKQVKQGSYIIGASKESRSNPDFKAAVSKLKKLSDIAVNDGKAVYFGGHEAFVSRVGVSEVSTAGINWEPSKEQIYPGTLMLTIYTNDGNVIKKQFSPNDLPDLAIE